MSIHSVKRHIAAFRPRGRRADRRARQCSQRASTVLPELHRRLAEPGADRGLEDRLVGHRDDRRGSARDRLLAALRRDAHLSRHARQPVRRARLAHPVSRARRRGEPPAGDDRRRAGQRGRRRRIQFRRHPARRHPANRTAARAAVRPLRRERAFRRAHHRHQIRTRPDQAGVQRTRRGRHAALGRGLASARGAAGRSTARSRRPTRPPTASTSRATAPSPTAPSASP